MLKKLIYIAFLSVSFKLILCLRPVAIVHGIMFNASDHMEFLRDEILRFDPNTTVELLEILHNQEVFYPMWEQVRQFQSQINLLMLSNPQGINLIGYSQGGMIARGVIETSPSHNIINFISLSSPQAGFHGELFTPRSIFDVGNEEKFSVSVSGLWKDPRDIVRYKKEGRYLACLNNDYPHELNQQFKATMCRLQRLVLIGGPDDGIVVPWQSAHFDFDDSYGRIIDMSNQEFYKNDCFCLRTLNERGAITKHVVAGVRHGDWYRNVSVIQNYILPHLT